MCYISLELQKIKNQNAENVSLKIQLYKISSSSSKIWRKRMASREEDFLTYSTMKENTSTHVGHDGHLLKI